MSKERTKLTEVGGRPIPVIVFPDGRELEFVPGHIFENAGMFRHELEAWLDAWTVPLPPVVMPSLPEEVPVS